MADDVKKAGSDLNNAGVTFPDRPIGIGFGGGTMGFGGELSLTVPKTNNTLSFAGTLNTGGEYASGGTPFHEGPVATLRADVTPLKTQFPLGNTALQLSAGVTGGATFDDRHGVAGFVGPIVKVEDLQGYNLSAHLGIPLASSNNPPDHNGYYKYHNIPIIAVTVGKKF